MWSAKIDNTVAAVVLAAGRGTRLGATDKPKVMAEIGGRPLVAYTVETLRALGFPPERLCLVVGFRKETVQDYFGTTITYAVQNEQQGTAHAAWCGVRELPAQIQMVLILGGDDSAFYTPGTLLHFMEQHRRADATMSVLTTQRDRPDQLGRIIRNAAGTLVRIAEKEELAPEEQVITEVNTGTYLVDRQWVERVFPTLAPIGGLKEYGLPALVVSALLEGKTVQAVKLENPEEWFGVNTSEELAEADRRKRLGSS